MSTFVPQRAKFWLGHCRFAAWINCSKGKWGGLGRAPEAAAGGSAVGGFAHLGINCHSPHWAPLFLGRELFFGQPDVGGNPAHGRKLEINDLKSPSNLCLSMTL